MTSNGHKKLGFIALSIATLGLGAGAALAQPGPGGDNFGGRGKERRAEILAKYDSNKDGKLDDGERKALHEARMAEMQKRRADMLAKYDSNKDGKLDDNERAVKREAHARERFSALDSNKDGQVSYAEFKVGADQMGKGKHHGHGFKMGHFGRGLGRERGQRGPK